MALSSLGHVYTAIGDYPNALASHKQCVLLAKQSKDQLSEARELGNMGAVYIAMGDFENAVQCHEQHLGIAKALENKREEARAYSNLGSAYHYHRNFDKAMSYHTHVLELAQELEEKSIEMRAYAGLGHAARCMQDLERAKQYHEQQLSIAEGLKDRAAEGRASSNLGMYPSITISHSLYMLHKKTVLQTLRQHPCYKMIGSFYFLNYKHQEESFLKYCNLTSGSNVCFVKCGKWCIPMHRFTTFLEGPKQLQSHSSMHTHVYTLMVVLNTGANL